MNTRLDEAGRGNSLDNSQVLRVDDWTPLWVRSLPRAAPFQDPSLQHVAAASDGSVFVSILTEIGAAQFTKLGADGEIVWSLPYAARSGVVFIAQDKVALGDDPLRVIDRRTGALLWQSPVVGVPEDITLDQQGNILLLVTVGGDFVVHRWTVQGASLPSWQVPVGSEGSIQANALVAYPDGGAVITGRGNSIGGGYLTARLDGDGVLVFKHVELGSHGNPLGPSMMMLDVERNVVVAGSPESAFGVAQAMIWKLSPTGEVVARWTAPNAEPFAWKAAQNMVFTSNGEVHLLISGICDHRLTRIDASLEQIVADTGSLEGQSIGVAFSPNGRSLITADKTGCGGGVSQIVELDDSGLTCRTIHRADLQRILPASHADDWLLAGLTPFQAPTGSEGIVEQHRQGVACRPAIVFGDGFEN